MHTTASRKRRRYVALGLSTVAVMGFGLLPAATAVPAPSAGDVTLVSGGDGITSSWTVENDGAAGDGTPGGAECDWHPGLSVKEADYDAADGDVTDALDTGLAFFVGGAQLVAPETWELDIDDAGVVRAVTAAPIETVDGLEATVEYRAMSSQQVLRSMVWLTNDTSEPTTTQFTVATNVGSDDATLIVGSSTGDTEFTAADRWLVTSDHASLPTDPVVTHVFAGPGQLGSAPVAVSSQVFECWGTEGARATFEVTVAPETRRGLVFFNELSAVPADALSAAARFSDTPDAESELFSGLSAEDLAAVANWNLEGSEPEPEPVPAPAPAPRDSVAPESAASGPAVSTSGNWSVDFSASDVGDGVGSVELFVKLPGATEYTSAGKVVGQQSGTFAFDAAGVDGTYSFYTVATDLAGNVEPVPTAADVTTVLDRSGPSSSATSPAFTRGMTFPVRYAVDGGSGSEPTSVELFVRKPGASRYVEAASDLEGDVDGEFAFTATREGRYRFYTVATDAAGNTEATPTRADARTRVDLTAPSVEPRPGRVARFDLGKQKPVDLRMWVSERGTTSFVVRQHGGIVRHLKPGDTKRGMVTGSWDLRDDDGSRVGPGRYVLVMKAVDRAGNRTAVRTPMRLAR